MTLAADVLDWMAELPSPSDPSQPLVLTDWQAEFVFDFYSVDPLGEFIFRRGHAVEPKGAGKSPLGGAIGACELFGPPAEGLATPYVQIVSVSESSATSNVYRLLFGWLKANSGRVASKFGVDVGMGGLYLPAKPGARLEPVTSAAESREGQRITCAVMDEVHLWTPQNGGVRLARTVRRNLAKTGGRSVELSNAPQLGVDSVAEATARDFAAGAPGILYAHPQPSRAPEPEMDDEELLTLLGEVYSSSPWIDRTRILKEVRDPDSPWSESLRYFFNLASPGTAAAIDPQVWAGLQSDTAIPDRAAICAGFYGDGPAVALVGCVVGERPHVFSVGSWERSGKEWRTPRAAVNAAVEGMFERFAVKRFYIEQRSWPDEAARWVDDHGETVVLQFPTASRVRMAPAIDRVLALVEQGALSHSGDAVLARHVGNAIRRGDLLEPAGPGRPIAAVKAAVLALAANADVPAKPREFLLMDAEWIEQRRKEREEEAAGAPRQLWREMR